MRTKFKYVWLIVAGWAYAAHPGEVVSSFAVPGLSANGPRGLAFDGTETYAVADNRAPNQVRILKFTYDGHAASVVGSFPCPSAVFWAMDLAWRPDPGRLYVACDLTAPTAVAKIYVLNDQTGNLTNHFPGPFAPGQHVNGLAWAAGYLYASSYDSPWVYKMNYAGSVVASFKADHAANHGLAARPAGALWLVSGRTYYDVRLYDPGSGARLRTFGFDVGDEYVGGASRGRPDLGTIFVAVYTGPKLIYEIATSPAEGEPVAVTPVSFGRIKALFR